MRNMLAVVLISTALAACIETAGSDRLSTSEPASGAKARSQASAKSAPDKSAPAKSAAAPSSQSLPDQARAQLQKECMTEHSGPYRTNSATAGECSCFAGTVVKQLRPADIEFYMTYDVVPTLSGTRPEDVKKQCGIAVVDRSGPRGPAPKN